MKYLWWTLGLIPVLYLLIVLIHGTLNDYQPEEIEPLQIIKSEGVPVIQDSILSFMIWNIGYTGLGAESDFFYEKGALLSKGSMVRPSQEISTKNLEGIKTQIKQAPVDFYLLQEVDYEAKRSYGVNQLEEIAGVAAAPYVSYGLNYKVDRVPVPVLEPWRVYGKVNSGLGTFSKYQAKEADRLQLPGDYAWPTRIFMLDRCAALHRFPTKNGKELVLINIHNSAYDDGSLKAQQMSYLKTLFLKEYEKGNYVIAGGDWNQCPPFFPFDTFMPGQGGDYSQKNIDPEMMPSDWQWIYDPTVPTNRKVAEPFFKGGTFVTLIDFFLVSPNLQVRKARGINIDFEYSDHQPLWMEVELR